MDKNKLIKINNGLNPDNEKDSILILKKGFYVFTFLKRK